VLLETKPLAEINQQAFKVLYRELGIVNTVRFLKPYSTGYGDYTKEREALFSELTLAEITSEIKRKRDNSLGVCLWHFHR
jgi:hypothetical protein